MEEQLINFDTAKLAKEKGYFNGIYKSYTQYHINYDYDDDPNHPESYKKNEIRFNGSFFHINNFEKNDYSNEYYTIYEAPTQSLLQKWLREKHGIHILVEPSCEKVPKYLLKLYDDNNLDECKFVADYGCLWYDSYEEALEIGLQEALKLI
jgi:hypothetical protein